MKVGKLLFLSTGLLVAWLLTSCADLVVEDLDYSPADPDTQTQITFSAVVRNAGTIPSGPSSVAMKVGGETTPELIALPALDINETFEVERRVYLKTAQNYQNRVTVDPHDEVDELRETNNEATLSYQVHPGIPYFAGAYYYPWYGNDFHGGGYLRQWLVPTQAPSLGEYDDRDPAVIAQHLDWSRSAGLDFWVTSWWGPGDRTDQTALNVILPHRQLGDFKIALFYETVGLTDGYSDYSNVGPHVKYIAENYFNHPNYLTLESKPVLFVYLTRDLAYQGTLPATVETMRSAAAEAGYVLYIVGDHAFGAPPGSAGDIAVLDAITNYDVYGAMGRTGYASQAGVDAYYADQAGWQLLAHNNGIKFIPSAAPGFNNRAVSSDLEPLSRRLESDDEFGSLFRAMVAGAKQQVDPDIGNMLMVTSWNEWHEDTQIEPVTAATAINMDDSPSGSDFTHGLEYVGYEDLYLEILHNELDP